MQEKQEPIQTRYSVDEWNKRQDALYALNPSIVSKEYLDEMKKQPIKHKLDEAKKIFIEKIMSATNKSFNDVVKIIKEEESYKAACTIFVDYCFGFENEKLKNKGGIYIWGEPGTGKTCLLITVTNILNNLGILKGNGWKRHNWFNMTNDISKKVKGGNPDLTYNIESSIIIDDLTERINQVSHFDYKFSLNEILQIRYNLWRSNNYFTLMSSNIHHSEFNKFMDERSITRFQEQYLVIELLGKNKRHK